MPDAEPHVTIELNPRERRLYDQLRARVVDAPPGAASGLRDLMLLMPDLTVMLVRLLRDERVPRGSKLVALLGLGYVLSPIDLVPALLFGPIGLVDDLLVVSATLSRLVNHVHPDVVRDAWPGQGDALAAIQGLAAWSEGVFGARLRHALRGLLGADSRTAR
jgi:uncharacterized membrane protein YkvA (DUF1232 family)